MRYAKLLLVSIGVLLLAGCVAEKRLKLCQTDNEALTLKVADQRAEMDELEEIMKKVVADILNETKKVKEQLKQAKAESAKIRKELSIAQEARKKDRARMEKALKSAMGKIAETEKKVKGFVESYKACKNKAEALKKELVEANKKLKDAESKAAELTEENSKLKAKIAAPPKITGS